MMRGFQVADAAPGARQLIFVEIMLAVLCAPVKHDDARMRIETQRVRGGLARA